MAKIITAAATIKCVHQGTVTVPSAGQSVFSVDGSAVLVEGDLVGAQIAGCTPAPGVKPCTATTSMILGAALRMQAGGKPVLLDTAMGLTDSSPPGTWNVQSAGQSSVEGV